MRPPRARVPMRPLNLHIALVQFIRLHLPLIQIVAHFLQAARGRAPPFHRAQRNACQDLLRTVLRD